MSSSRLVFGGFIILLGIGFLLQQFGIYTFWGLNLWSFWPLIFIVLGLMSFNNRNPKAGLFLCGLGVIFLIGEFTKLNVWGIFWPAIIILIGISMLFPKTKEVGGFTKKSSTQDTIDENILFWGTQKIINSKNFRGGNISCWFGGFELDLRNVEIAKVGAELKINSGFGGVEVKVSDKYRVETKGSAFFGGVDEKNRNTENKTLPLLKINANVMFGGIEIKN